MNLLVGKFLVKAARTYLKAKFANPRSSIEFDWPKACEEKLGCFVTLSTYPGKALRGCVGFTEPIFPLKDALLEAAFSAAFRDSRFPPLGEGELPKTLFEVSVLTKPKRIFAKDVKKLISSVEIGTDGLIVRYRSFSGLLLPQVPVELGWNVPEFISQTCQKAGLPPDIWVTNFSSLTFSKFQSEIFSEDKPEGKIVRSG
ncbi:MAG: TIGR00296 family protein [archaeon]